MKKISTQLLTVFGFMTLLLMGCNNDAEFTVSGVVSGADGKTMYFENVGVLSAESVETIDSIKLNAGGKFKFKHPSPQNPEFYRFRLNNQLINFSVDSTENIVISADAGTFATSYSVEGSENSKAIKAITLAQLDAVQTISKLRKEYEGKFIADSTYQRQELEAKEVYKEFARKYIYSAPMSAAAYFALFQPIDGLLFFDLYDKTDSKAFAAVATSFDHYYPGSLRAKHLHNLALQSIKIIRGQRALNTENVNIQEINYFDIDLPTLNGEKVPLSSVAKDKVVLINFTAYQSEWSPAINMTFADLYSKYKDKGLVIYQISLDSDLHYWKNIASKLPWTCVNDPQSVYSQIAAIYNVRQLPAVFLLDRKGNMVKRIEDVASLESSIKTLL